MKNRVNFFRIVNNHPKLEKTDTILFPYYSFIAEAYNKNFHFAYEHVAALRGKISYLSPKLKENWWDEDTQDEKIFEGIIRISKGRKRIHVIDLQQTFDLIAGDYSAFPESSRQYVVLHFYPRGIKAEVVQVIFDEPEGSESQP